MNTHIINVCLIMMMMMILIIIIIIIFIIIITDLYSAIVLKLQRRWRVQ